MVSKGTSLAALGQIFDDLGVSQFSVKKKNNRYSVVISARGIDSMHSGFSLCDVVQCSIVSLSEKIEAAKNEEQDEPEMNFANGSL